MRKEKKVIVIVNCHFLIYQDLYTTKVPEMKLIDWLIIYKLIKD